MVEREGNHIMLNYIAHLVAIPWESVGHLSPLPTPPKEEHTRSLPYYTTGFL